MNNSLSDLYDQILLNEAEKHALENPSQDEVGKLKTKADFFGSTPKPVEGPDKATVKQGPSYKETTGTTSKPKGEKTSMPNSAPAKSPEPKEGKEMKDTKVNPKSEEDEEKDEQKKSKVKEESFAMSSFEALFKKTLQEELMPEDEFGTTEEASDEDPTSEDEPEEEEEADLVSDLRDLQDKLASILAKLEDVAEDDEEEESEDYSEEDFDSEFGEEDETEEAVKESMDRPKALNNSKGKGLMNKKNKVGKINPKGGKAHAGKVTNSPSPKALGDKKGTLQKGKPEVKSSVKKGDLFK
jgi:hypothetical protein